MRVSGKSHSAENLEQCFMLAKRFVSSKNWGGFDENKLEKSRIEKTAVLKKQKSDIACWAWENLILRQKLFDLKNLTMPKTVKGGTLRFFKHPFCCKISKNWSETWKILQKKTKNENFQQSHSCDLRSETRELSRGKKAPALSHNTCLSQV